MKSLQEISKQNQEMNRWLLWSSLFSIALVTLRLLYTNSWVLVHLAWNLFLAWIPYWITIKMNNHSYHLNNKWKFILLSLLWLLFIPNAFYILTDLFHLKDRAESSRWIDLTIIFSFAWNGLMMGIISVWRMEKIITPFLPGKKQYYFLYPLMGLIALGVYIGRYGRFNSWDIISDPFDLAGVLLNLFIHPFQNLYPWIMISCFAVFIILVYGSIKRLGAIVS